MFSGHPKNMNNVHRYTKDILAVIITLGTNYSGGENVFKWNKTSDLGKEHKL